MPIFFYHLYVVTHKEQISKRTLNESSEDPIDVEKIIQYSHASSDFHWRDSTSSGQVGRGSDVGSLISSQSRLSMPQSQGSSLAWDNYDDRLKCMNQNRGNRDSKAFLYQLPNEEIMESASEDRTSSYTSSAVSSNQRDKDNDSLNFNVYSAI